MSVCAIGVKSYPLCLCGAPIQLGARVLMDPYMLPPFRDSTKIGLGPIKLLKRGYLPKCPSGSAVLQPDNEVNSLSP